MKPIGIIVNPASGSDLRRIVAHGTAVTHSDKINTLVRILRALDALGVTKVRISPDPGNLGLRAIERIAADLAQIDAAVFPLPWLLGARSDTERVASGMRAQDYACIVVLGGDGTCRAVAAHCGELPLIAVSTGTNNAFPRMIEGTLVGMAAACLARGLDDAGVIGRAPLLRLYADEVEVSQALVDIAVIDTLDKGAGVIWESTSIRELFLAQARPDSIGLSAIGGCLDPLAPGGTEALHIELDPQQGTEHLTLLAPMAPGLVARLAIRAHRRFADRCLVRARRGIFAFDGERELQLDPAQRWEVALDPLGPRVVDVSRAIATGVARGFFRAAPGQHSTGAQHGG